MRRPFKWVVHLYCSSNFTYNVRRVQYKNAPFLQLVRCVGSLTNQVPVDGSTGTWTYSTYSTWCCFTTKNFEQPTVYSIAFGSATEFRRGTRNQVAEFWRNFRCASFFSHGIISAILKLFPFIAQNSAFLLVTELFPPYWTYSNVQYGTYVPRFRRGTRNSSILLENAEFRHFWRNHTKKNASPADSSSVARLRRGTE